MLLQINDADSTVVDSAMMEV